MTRDADCSTPSCEYEHEEVEETEQDGPYRCEENVPHAGALAGV